MENPGRADTVLDAGQESLTKEPQRRLARIASSGCVFLKFEKDEALIARCKEFSKRFYKSAHKEWVVTLSTPEDLAQMDRFLADFQFRIYDMAKLIRYRDSAEARRAIEHSFAKTQEEAYDIPFNPGCEYLDFQRAGIWYMEKIARGRVLVADEMGLGKSIEALGYANRILPKGLLIVTQSSVKKKWERECRTWLVPKGQTIQCLFPKTKWDPSADVLIINYELLQKFKKDLMAKPFEMIVLDEVHYVQNHDARRTKIVNDLVVPIRHRIFLSGTPMTNRPINGWTILTMLRPEIFGDYLAYAERYCGAKRTRFGLDVRGASNIEEFHNKLRSTVMVRRLKTEVLKQLPDKRRVALPLVIEGYADDEKILNRLKEKILELKKLKKIRSMDPGIENHKRRLQHEVMKLTDQLKKAAVLAKLPLCIDHIQTMVDEQKVIVFAHHQDVVAELERAFAGISVTADGSTVDREAAINRFQTDESIRIFIGSITAAGVGIDLTAASNVVFTEIMWSPALHSQAEDRCHRIGQKDSVSCFYMGVENSIEWKLLDTLNKKQETLKKILDGTPGRETIIKMESASDDLFIEESLDAVAEALDIQDQA
jgi:SNF2 family DNA or RNA helicase